MENDLLIQYENVEICRDENIVLKNVSFEQRKGDFLYIIG
jgi:ABC-type Mn2+/Zn2+ transport system ATPase subunit